MVVTPLFHGCVESAMNGGRTAHSHHFLLLFYRFCEHNRASASKGRNRRGFNKLRAIVDILINLKMDGIKKKKKKAPYLSFT